MYNILISMFFIRGGPILVLIHKSKINVMETKTAKSEMLFSNKNQELIDDCKKGDQKAQFQIYKLYYKAMYNISLRILNDPMEAEDIMQESFLQAFEKIGTYSGTVSFGAWLRKIVQNKSIDTLRKKNLIVFESIESCQTLVENYTDNSEANEEPEQILNKIKDAVKQLPEKCRNILSLYLLEGYDHEEISEVLSISASTSRSQYSRARQKLIRIIEGR